MGSLERSSLEDDLCEPLNELNGVWLNPCGLIANTFFNDIIKLEEGTSTSSDGNESLVMLEKGIAWKSDLEFRFNQPIGFKYEECEACDASCCSDDEDSEWPCNPEEDKKGEPYLYIDTDYKYTDRSSNKNPVCNRYSYPNEKTTQYLYEVRMCIVLYYKERNRHKAHCIYVESSWDSLVIVTLSLTSAIVLFVFVYIFDRPTVK